MVSAGGVKTAMIIINNMDGLIRETKHNLMHTHSTYLYITTTTNKKKMKNYPYKPIKYYETENNIPFYLAMIVVVFVLLNVINT